MDPSALQRYQRYLLYTLVLFLPLIITPNGRDIFRLGKEVFAQILALAIVSLAAAEAAQTDTLRGFPRALLWPLSGFCFWAATAVFWSPVRPLALDALFNLVLFSLLTLCLARLLAPRVVRFLILLNLLPASLTGIYTLIQYLGLDPLLLTPQGTALVGRENAGGLVGDVNTAGCYLAVTLMLSINSIFLEESVFRRVFASIACAAILAGLLCTQTLTALVATAVAGVVLAALNSCLFLFSPGGRRLLWLVSLLLLITAAFAGALFALRNPAFRSRLATRYEDLRAGDWARLTSYRAPIFAVTGQMARERLWTGHGLNSFETDFYAAKLRYRPGRLITMPKSVESTPRQAHNEYLQLWAELGLVGVAALLLTLGGLLSLGFAGLSRAALPENRYLMVSALSALATILVVSLSLFPAHLALTGLWIAIVSAAIASLGRHASSAPPDAAVSAKPAQGDHKLAAGKRQGDARSLARTSHRSSTAAAAQTWVPATAAVAVALLGGYWRLSPLIANEQIDQATALIERVMQGGDLNSAAYLERSLALLDSARRRNPLEPQIYQSAGTACWYLSRFDEALEHFSRAALLDPTPEAFTNMGEAYRGLGQLDAALKAFESALAYNPEFERARNAKAFLESLKAEKPTG